MKRLLLLFSCLAFSAVVQATPMMDVLTQMTTNSIEADAIQGLDWEVGQKSAYKIKMGFMTGKMNMLVREEVEQGFWLNQKVEMMGQQQLVEALIDKNTGQVLRLIVNGEEKDPPERGNMEVVEMEESTMTVPAGTFEVIYIKIRDNNENKEMEQWVNPKVIPINGMVKSVSPGQFGKVILELTSFQK